MNLPPLLRDLLKYLLHPRLLRHITLPCLECLTGEFFPQLGGDFFSVFGGAIEDGDVTTGFGDGAGEGETDPAVAAGDDEILLKAVSTSASSVMVGWFVVGSPCL